jgi:hypothetical protein
MDITRDPVRCLYFFVVWTNSKMVFLEQRNLTQQKKMISNLKEFKHFLCEHILYPLFLSAPLNASRHPSIQRIPSVLQDWKLKDMNISTVSLGILNKKSKTSLESKEEIDH